MTLRRLLFWLHLSAGVTVGLVLAFLAVTGTILSFETQLIAAAEHGIHASHPAGATCVAPSTLLANAAVTARGPLTNLTLFTDTSRPAQIATGNEGAVLLADPCTGRILGPGASRLRVFLKTVQELHHQVALAGVRHETLRAIKNAAVLAFVFLLLSGLYLWFPRELSWQHLRPSVLFRSGLRGRAREWNLHNLAGFWLCLPLLAISLTGVIMAYPWANTLLFHAAGEQPPAPRQPEPRRPASSQPRSGHADRHSRTEAGDHRDHGPAPASSAAGFTSLDAPFARALAFVPPTASVSLRLPAPEALAHTEALTFAITRTDRQPVLREQLTLAPGSAAVLRWEPLADASRGRRWRTGVRFLHTGELLGIPGQAIALLSALGLLLLIWTGFSLALRRLAAFRRRRYPVFQALETSPVPDSVRVS